MFEDAGLSASSAPEALSLKGRLLKDRGLQTEGEDRALLLKRAQEAYLQAAGDRPATYPLINAATIAFLNDRSGEARELAETILAILTSGEHEAETRYWLAATEAEARLLLDDRPGSLAALEQAMQAAPQAWEDHAVTLRQFRRILERLGHAPDYFDHLQPPPSLYFSGIIGLPQDETEVRARLEEALDEIRPGAVFGALAAGTDILVAEMAQARGAHLHVVLPTSVARFREISVARYGDLWSGRFDRLIEEADVVESLDANAGLSEAAILNGSRVAMGLALRHAHSLATRAVALQVSRPADTAAFSETEWRAQGLPVHQIVLADSLPAREGELDPARSRAIIASVETLPETSASRPLAEAVVDGVSILAFDDLVAATEHAVSLLHAVPEIRLGLDHRAVDPGEELELSGELAILLAQAAPPGSICASWPQIATLDLLAPQFRFESAGEVVTTLGDVPIGLYCPRSS